MLTMRSQNINYLESREEEGRRRIELMKEAGEEICKTPESARKFLIKNGYITEDGKLTKQYGGEG